jgi:hypothetical protein
MAAWLIRFVVFLSDVFCQISDNYTNHVFSFSAALSNQAGPLGGVESPSHKILPPDLIFNQ